MPTSWGNGSPRLPADVQRVRFFLLLDLASVPPAPLRSLVQQPGVEDEDGLQALRQETS